MRAWRGHSGSTNYTYDLNGNRTMSGYTTEKS
jgi:hypothetical protein